MKTLKRIITEEIERRKIEWYEETFRDERLIIDALIRLKMQNKRQADSDILKMRMKSESISTLKKSNQHYEKFTWRSQTMVRREKKT